MKKNKLIKITIIICVAVLIIGLVFSKESLLLFLSNSYFLISIILLIIGLFAAVLKDGTFDFFYYSLKKAKDRIFNSENSDTSTLPDEDALHQLSQSIHSSYKNFIKIGVFFLLISIICLIIFYL